MRSPMTTLAALTAGFALTASWPAAGGAAELLPTVEACEDAYNQGDHARALELCTPLAERGNMEGLYALGDMHAEGLGVAADAAKAEGYYAHAAGIERGERANFDPDKYNEFYKEINEGDVDTMRRLGGYYISGNYTGIPKNTAEGLKLYEMAAGNGDVESMEELGELLAEGEDVPADPARADVWLERAIAAGSVKALFGSGRLYMEGNGVPRDPYQAYLRFSLFERNGGRIIGVGDPQEELAKELTDRQLIELRRVARSWKPGQPLPGSGGAAPAAKPARATRI